MHFFLQQMCDLFQIQTSTGVMVHCRPAPPPSAAGALPPASASNVSVIRGAADRSRHVWQGFQQH